MLNYQNKKSNRVALMETNILKIFFFCEQKNTN